MPQLVFLFLGLLPGDDSNCPSAVAVFRGRAGDLVAAVWVDKNDAGMPQAVIYGYGEAPFGGRVFRLRLCRCRCAPVFSVTRQGISTVLDFELACVPWAVSEVRWTNADGVQHKVCYR